MNGNDVAAVVDEGQTDSLQTRLEDARLGLVFVAQPLVGLQMRDARRRAAATEGGSEVVKMKPGA